MKTFCITIFCCLALTSYSFSQQGDLSASEKKQIEHQKDEAKRHKTKYITGFMATLDVDDFEKQIITQALYSYFDEIVKINKLRLKYYERETHIENLDDRHFKDIKSMVSEEIMLNIMDAVKGKWKENEAKKKKKKKKRNNNK